MSGRQLPATRTKHSLNSGNNLLAAQGVDTGQFSIGDEMVKGLIRSAAVIMLGLGISLSTAGWPEAIRQHPRAVIAVWVLTGILSIIAVTQLFMASGPKKESPSMVVGKGNQAGRDNTGTQIGGSVIGTDALEKILQASARAAQTPSRLYIQSAEYVSIDDPTRLKVVTECLRQMIVDDQLVLEVENFNFVAGGINYVPKDPHAYHKKKLCVVYSFDKGPLQAVAVMEESVLRIPQPPSASIDSKKVPSVILNFLKTQPSVLYWENNRWIESTHTELSELAILLWVQNPLADLGEEPNPRARDIAAHIKFTGDSGVQGPIFSERAYWLGERQNNVNIDPGKSKAIVLGTYHEGSWKVWNNDIETKPLRVSMQTLRNGTYLDFQEAKFVDRVLCKKSMNVEVNLIEKDSGRPIAQTTLTIKYDETEEVFGFIAMGGV